MQLKILADVTVRVETEHLGNADAYRVTREIPLPYRRVGNESSEDEHVSLVRAQSRRTAGKQFSGQFDRLRTNLVNRRNRAGKPQRQDTILDPPISESAAENAQGGEEATRSPRTQARRQYEAGRKTGHQSGGSGDTVDLDEMQQRRRRTQGGHV